MFIEKNEWKFLTFILETVEDKNVGSTELSHKHILFII